MDKTKKQAPAPVPNAPENSTPDESAPNAPENLTPNAPGNSTPDESAPNAPENSTPAAPAPAASTPAESAPDFVFLGIPRAEWGTGLAAAYEAEQAARKADADLAPAVEERDKLLAEVAAAESALFDAQEKLPVADDRRQAAANALSTAMTRDDVISAQLEVNKAEADWQALERKANETRQALTRLRELLSQSQMNLNAAESASRAARQHADELAEFAKNVEVHDILERKRMQEESERRDRYFNEQTARRAPFVKTRCQDCRHWSPRRDFPMRDSVEKGECRARPPASSGFPHAFASDWCGLCEPLPDSAPAAGADAAEQA